MKTTIQKWGNSSGIRLPKPLLQELHLDNGTEVELERVGDGIMMYPRRPTREETSRSPAGKNKSRKYAWH
nr:AbrB/MazE/SpoVT family DNA-binding domain-containing protein [uncultured Sphaerochaeta sp.]